MAVDPARILVVRLSAMGDVLTTLPAFEILAEAFPGSRFAWAVEAPFAPLVEGLPRLERVITLRTKGWRRGPFAARTRAEFAAAVASLRDFAPTLTIDFQGTLKSAVVSRLSAAPERIGLGDGHLREPAAALFYTGRGEPLGHGEPASVLERGLDFASTIARRHASASGDPTRRAPHAYALHLARDPAGSVERFVGGLEAPFALLQPGAGWKNKEWGAERFGLLARRLKEQLGLVSVVAWGPGEQDLAKESVTNSEGTARMAPATTIPELAELARRASVAVGGDTGPVHLAAAMGIPTLALLGPTGSVRHAPWGPRASFVEFDLACHPCNRRYDSRKPCLDSISVESVAGAVVKLLS